jgi:hypothetical protein
MYAWSLMFVYPPAMIAGSLGYPSLRRKNVMAITKMRFFPGAHER